MDSKDIVDTILKESKVDGLRVGLYIKGEVVNQFKKNCKQIGLPMSDIVEEMMKRFNEDFDQRKGRR